MKIENFAKIVAEGLEVDPLMVGPDTNPSDIEEWDSLGHLTLLMHLEKEFNGITNDMPELAGAGSVREMYEMFASKCSWS
jgi:acyl carrier protein